MVYLGGDNNLWLTVCTNKGVGGEYGWMMVKTG